MTVAKKLAFLVWLAPFACAPTHDGRLAALRSSLTKMREQSPTSGELRGATARLTDVKHQLRDWVEYNLVAFPERGDECDLQRQLNSRLAGEELL